MPYTYRFFLSANSYGGYKSLYRCLAEKCELLHVIKGGPGCGKSGFMKAIGKRCTEAGVHTEFIHCAGDPESVDGIRMPELGCAFVDGTSPHVTEPELAGCTGTYVDLGSFCDFDEVSKMRNELIEMEHERKELWKRGFSLISAAGKAEEGIYHRLHTKRAIESAEKRACGIAGREFTKGTGKGQRAFRFLSAFTYHGIITFRETVENMCRRIYYIDDEYGFGQYMIDVLAEKAADFGLDSVLCMSPLKPETPEALLVPGVSVAFLCGRDYEAWGDVYRHVRLDAIADREVLADERCHIRASRKISEAALEQGRLCLESAKRLHDKIEELYNPYINFEGVYAMAEQYSKKILSER